MRISAGPDADSIFHSLMADAAERNQRDGPLLSR